MSQAGRADIETVLVASRVLKGDGRLVAGGLDGKMKELENSGRRIVAEPGMGPDATHDAGGGSMRPA